MINLPSYQIKSGSDRTQNTGIRNCINRHHKKTSKKHKTKAI